MNGALSSLLSGGFISSLSFFLFGCFSQNIARTHKIMQETNLHNCMQLDTVTSLCVGHEFVGSRATIWEQLTFFLATVEVNWK